MPRKSVIFEDIVYNSAMQYADFYYLINENFISVDIKVNLSLKPMFLKTIDPCSMQVIVNPSKLQKISCKGLTEYN